MSLDFLGMIGTYQQRKVARLDKGDLMVSTAAVSDGAKPFETAIRHPLYNQGKHVIVEAYETREEAVIGHQRWEERMTADKLPLHLVDVANSEISQLCDAIGCVMVYEKGVTDGPTTTTLPHASSTGDDLDPAD